MNNKIKPEDETGKDRDYLQGKDLSNETNICRGKTPLINDQEDNFKFMQIDVDYYTSREFPGKYYFIDLILSLAYLKQNTGFEHAVLRMYGITEGGHSVMLHIHNFLPYMYVEVSDDVTLTNENLEGIKK
jgi:hypothetical protein